MLYPLSYGGRTILKHANVSTPDEVCVNCGARGFPGI